ncbi:hypothetical protein D8B26_006628 [Coccidioides posadasii str. Silveira]|uniref:catechol O-methyltransferase n=1 Tax=Coccidioides posadasii (strain RMSCC 757 / Silveira) TaxID=443226 RepID=E9CUC1_COCPS|nr:catechol O-methyltransferase [Coccidioides posadasii str. Silveira]QVM11991.1 hypothetical protein D8B26_006628 [Coccidioides posadasii str. Silveira]
MMENGPPSEEYYLPRDSRQRRPDDRREIELLHYVYSRPNLEELRGCPEKVLGAIDEFGKKKAYLMNVGQRKGKIVTSLIEEVKPQVMIELGSYVGYSAILFGDALRRVGGKKYYTLEKSPEYAAVANMLLDLAGLRDFVKVLVGSSDVLLHKLCTTGEIITIELMFLDHFKPAYTTDLKLCEQLGMVAAGTVLAADNMIMPGNPVYLDYVRSSVETKRSKAKTSPSGYEIFSQNIMSWYVDRDAKPAFDAVGNPNLIYESRLVESFEPSGEPDGIEITRCVGAQEPNHL